MLYMGFLRWIEDPMHCQFTEILKSVLNPYVQDSTCWHIFDSLLHSFTLINFSLSKYCVYSSSSSFFAPAAPSGLQHSSIRIVLVGDYIIGIVPLMLNAICTNNAFNLRMVAITPARSCMFIPHWSTTINIQTIILLPTPVDKRKQHIFSYSLKSCFVYSWQTPHEQNVPSTG
jgi:hypothetical protein